MHSFNALNILIVRNSTEEFTQVDGKNYEKLLQDILIDINAESTESSGSKKQKMRVIMQFQKRTQII